jgi:LuxR family maltose regulon positive regulatory protein
VLGALARNADGRAADALEHLAETVRLAEPEGSVQVVADEGAPMARLLAPLAKRRATPFLRRLLDAATTTRAVEPDQPGLAAPLSARELDVLRLLDSALSGADIARELSISLNTMRSHTKAIFTKLGVTSRPAAVRRAADLGLLGR